MPEPIGNEGAITLSDDKQYSFVAALKGRGQAGVAGFYKSPESNVYLVKEDDPATCVAESLALSRHDFDPNFTEEEAIIHADITMVKKEEGSKIASIQPGFQTSPNEKMIGFDLLCLGHKRNPKTTESEEFQNIAGINAVIDAMSDEVKEQLAEAIFLSQLNGDESLHTAQFMVSVNDKNEISKIQRIDFGALGRYAADRQGQETLFNTSTQYKNKLFTQFKNDYVSYLLQNPVVNHSLAEKWKAVDISAAVTAADTRFDQQMQKITDPDIKKKALQGFMNNMLGSGSLTDKAAAKIRLRSSSTIDLPGLEKEVRALWVTTIKTRSEQLQKAAVTASKKLVDAQTPAGGKQNFLRLNDSALSLEAQKALFVSTEVNGEPQIAMARVVKTEDGQFRVNIDRLDLSTVKEQKEREEIVGEVATQAFKQSTLYEEGKEPSIYLNPKITLTPTFSESLKYQAQQVKESIKGRSDSVSSSRSSASSEPESRLSGKESTAEGKQTTVLDHKSFDVSSAESSGGMSGSMKVKRQDEYYQLKSSVLNEGLVKQVKEKSTDKVNLGEKIAACIAKAVHPDASLVPDVSLVHHVENNQVWIASKYLLGVQGTLDDYAKGKKADLESAKHVRFVKDYSGKKGEIRLAEVEALRPSLAQAIALSVMIGDHDVNPGNMLVVGSKDNPQVARIDFGHAFNDLLSWGNEVAPSKGVMDFLNRERLPTLKLNGGKSKLWRDYPGMVPSAELAKAFREIAGRSEHISSGIVSAKADFLDLYQQAAPALQQHMVKSLGAIYKNVTQAKLTEESPEKNIETVFEALSHFCTENGKQMQTAAELMDLQLAIDQKIEGLTSDFPTIDPKFIEPDGKIQWIKAREKEPAFRGTLEEYVQHRTAQLNLKKDNAAPSTLAVRRLSSAQEGKFERQAFYTPVGDKKKSVIVRIFKNEQGFQAKVSNFDLSTVSSRDERVNIIRAAAVQAFKRSTFYKPESQPQLEILVHAKVKISPTTWEKIKCKVRILKNEIKKTVAEGVQHIKSLKDRLSAGRDQYKAAQAKPPAQTPENPIASNSKL
ncbi:MAG: hypothetical protein Q8R79_05010 [Legionellaceae bacterium]|nr:hypothetical protein [Legionellaceae bacterium]